MAGATSIEWCDTSWNPIVGCTITSPGCKNCYAMGQAARIERMAVGAGRTSHYAGLTEPSNAGPVWTGKVAMASEAALAAPLRWRKPRRIFVNSMGDLFARGVTDEMRDKVWAVMACAPWHTFIVLTKQAAAMRAYLRDLHADEGEGKFRLALVTINHPSRRGRAALIELVDWEIWQRPLSNIWLGVTAEDQTRADERIPNLLATPAAVRFVSYEPAIGPVDFRTLDLTENLALDALTGFWSGSATFEGGFQNAQAELEALPSLPAILPGLDWVICGGESGRGPGIRPMQTDWARRSRDQCADAGVPFFFKQWGAHLPGAMSGEDDRGRPAWELDDETCGPLDYDDLGRGSAVEAYGREFIRFGRKPTGRLLDGRTHDAFPEARA